jgi:hypothetical protein
MMTRGVGAIKVAKHEDSQKWRKSMVYFLQIQKPPFAN